MPKVMITGAASRIGEASAILIAREIQPEFMLITDKPGKDLGRVSEKIREVSFLSKVEIREVDLANDVGSEAWNDLPLLDGLFLFAAAGLAGGLTPEQVKSINCLTQVALAEKVLLHHASAQGCSVVFMQSTWGHHPKHESVHPGYDPIAETKNAAERALRELGRTLQPPHKVAIVVASMVEKTGAALLYRRDLGRERFEKKVQAFPGERLVTIEEAANGVLEAFRSPNGTTIFVPKSASKLANEEMLALSERR
jgi:NADP-dependent 3-hydroxy acid dehydrogenase YdfG